MVICAWERIPFVAMDVAELVGHLVVTDPSAYALADDVKLALEVHRVGDVGAFTDKDLLDNRFVAAGCFS